MFQFLGVAIGGVGTLIGVAIGLVTCYVVSAYGYHLDPKVYLIDRLPIDVRRSRSSLVAGITMVDQPVRDVVPGAGAPRRSTPVEGCATIEMFQLCIRCN